MSSYHPVNQMRINAGLPIKWELEKQKNTINEARETPKSKSDLKPKNHRNLQLRMKGVGKAVNHLTNAIKSLESIPAVDFMGDIPHVIHELEYILNGDGSEPGGLSNILTIYQQELENVTTPVGEPRANESVVSEDHFKKGQEIKDKDGNCWKVVAFEGEGDDETYYLECPKSGKLAKKKYKDLQPTEKPLKEQNGNFDTKDSFSKGDTVIHDNGVWVVHVADAQADMVGIIPAGLKKASDQEKNKATQMVKAEKLRKPSEEECEIMVTVAPKTGEQQSTPPADINMDDRPATDGGDMQLRFESMHHYHDEAYPETHQDDDKKTPINVVSQSDDSYQTQPKDESPEQLDQRGDQSEDDYVNKIKVPNDLLKSLKVVIDDHKKLSEKATTGASSIENKKLHSDTANALQHLHDLLKAGTIQSMKKAQVFYSSLMGPIQYKIPAKVRDFIHRGGKARGLKDYMNDVSKKYPITGPRNTLDS